MLFYVLVFGALAVFVVIAAITKMVRSNRRVEEDQEVHHATQHAHVTTDSSRRIRKEKRTESRRERRKRK